MVDRGDLIRQKRAQYWSGGGGPKGYSSGGWGGFNLGSILGGGNVFGGGLFNGGGDRADRTRARRAAYWQNGGYPGAGEGWGDGYGGSYGNDYYSEYSRQTHRYHHHDGYGGGLWGGLMRAISDLFGGRSRDRQYARYEQESVRYAAPAYERDANGDVVFPDSSRRDHDSRRRTGYEYDGNGDVVFRDAREAALPARRHGASYAHDDGRDYMELTARERSEIQREARAQRRREENDWTRDIFRS